MSDEKLVTIDGVAIPRLLKNDLCPAPLFRLSMDGILVDFNGNFREALGYSDEQLIGIDIREIMEPYHARVFTRELFKLKSSGWSQARVRELIEATNFRIPFEFIGNTVDVEGVTLANYMCTEVTFENRKASKALEIGKRLMWTVADASRDGIIVLNNNGKLMLKNSAFSEIWNMPADVAESGDWVRMIQFCAKQVKEPGRFLVFMKSNPGTETVSGFFEMSLREDCVVEVTS